MQVRVSISARVPWRNRSIWGIHGGSGGKKRWVFQRRQRRRCFVGLEKQKRWKKTLFFVVYNLHGNIHGILSIGKNLHYHDITMILPWYYIPWYEWMVISMVISMGFTKKIEKFSMGFLCPISRGLGYVMVTDSRLNLGPGWLTKTHFSSLQWLLAWLGGYINFSINN